MLKNKMIGVSNSYEPKLAEFIGILLGDGSLSLKIGAKGQNRLKITFNSEEKQHIAFVKNLIQTLFGQNLSSKIEKMRKLQTCFHSKKP